MTGFSPAKGLKPSVGRRSPAFFVILFLQIGLLLAIPTGASADSRVDVAAAVTNFLPLNEVSAGMTGYGLTVFEGAAIDTFDVVVIGIQNKMRAAGSILVVEVSGHDLERSAIAQGMSGSPIFINDRFVGALAFGWAGALRPLAGVTPAKEILALPTSGPKSGTGLSAGTGPPLQALLAGDQRGTELARAVFPNEDASSYLPSVDRSLGQADWPDPRELARTLIGDLVDGGTAALPTQESWICIPVGQSAEGRSASLDKGGLTLKPGSACSVPLVVGDAQLGVIGTVTWVDEPNVYMMGHPFMQRGPVTLPLATAEVLTIFPSRQMSFKMGSVGQIIGSVNHDQRAGLSGRIGDAPRMIPVSVLVDKSTDDQVQTEAYDFQVVSDPLLTPSLVYWSLYSALLVQGDDASRQTLRFEIETQWDGPSNVSDEPLVFTGVTAGPGSAQALAAEWMVPLSILLNNKFSPVTLSSVKAKLHVSRPMASATIANISGPRTLVAGRQNVVFEVELEPRRGQREVWPISVTLPSTLQPGQYRLVAASAAELFALEAQRAAGRFQAQSLDATLELLRSERSNGDLVLALLAPSRSLILDGREMNGLPKRISRTLKSGNMQITPTLADYVLRLETETPWALQGHAVRALRVTAGAKPIKEETRP